jgi:hypothetical protein
MKKLKEVGYELNHPHQNFSTEGAIVQHHPYFTVIERICHHHAEYVFHFTPYTKFSVSEDYI